MSRVFTAQEVSLGRKVVVKVLPPDLAATVNVERFRREIQLAARLQHPHIVPVLTAGVSNGLPYFTMPFIEGESLRARLARAGELPVQDSSANGLHRPCSLRTRRRIPSRSTNAGRQCRPLWRR